MEQLPDIVMVFDGVGRLVDYDQAAGRVFRLASSVIGVRGDLALGDWPVLLEALDGGGGDVGVRQVGFSLPIEGKARKFEGFVYLLAGREVGMVQMLLLRDVTPAGRHGGDYFKVAAHGRSGRAARFAKRGLGGNVDQKWCWIHVEDAGRVGFP